MILPDLDSQMVDQIVRDVLERIAANGVRTLDPKPSDVKEPSAPATEVTIFSDPVLTEELLRSRVQQASRIEISKGTILTPSARDFLRLEKIQWTRSSANTSHGIVASSNEWSLLILNDAQRVKSIAKDLNDCRSELVGSNSEAVSFAVSKICRASNCGVVVCSEKSFEVACRSNRNSKVRAVVVNKAEDVEVARKQIDANVFCINPVSMPFFVLRNLLKLVMQTRPASIHKWSN